MKSLKFLLFLFFASCGSLIFGIKKIKPLSNDQIKKEIVHFNIGQESNYIIDTALYKKTVKELSFNKPDIEKDLLQPLQIKAYNAKGELVLHLINCYVGGVPNLKWNRQGAFNTFPPQQNYIYMPQSVLTLEKENKLIVPLMNCNIPSNDSAITLVVYWASFMGRQSKILISEIKRYKDANKDKNIRVLFVNIDNLF